MREGDNSLSLVFRRIVGIFFSQMFSNSTFCGKKNKNKIKTWFV